MRSTITLFILFGIQSLASAQPPAPQDLPASINAAPAVNGATLVRFDATQLMLRRVDGRWQLWADKQFLKDFGLLEREAHESYRLVRDLGYTQYGVIAGSVPVFEYWLSDEEGQKKGLAVKNVIAFNDKALRVDQITGAWIIRDDKQLLYNFGNAKEAAEQALGVMKKFGFNQLGVVGIPNPVMTYLSVDPYARPKQPMGQFDAKEMIGKITQQGLMLPNVGYVGSKYTIEPRRLDISRINNEYVLVHNKDVIGRFGANSMQAREALRLLQDAHVTEVCLVGKIGFPIFLSNGQAPRHAALGLNNLRVQPNLLKLQTINGVTAIVEMNRVLHELGDNKADAELVLKVLQHFQFDQIAVAGDISHGGIRLFLKSR